MLTAGYIVTYVAPLAFVLCVTMGKEAYDDYQRNVRDREANAARYLVLLPSTESSSLEEDAALPQPQTRSTPSSHLKVGDLVLLEKNQRVPADMVLFHTSEDEGTCFIRTDQLDGETDWKLKVAVEVTQRLGDCGLVSLEGDVYGASDPKALLTAADPPTKDIHAFIGTLTLHPTAPGPHPDELQQIPLTVDNVLWANTVLAAGSAIGFVVYTGKETRAVMNTSDPGTKVGCLEVEINRMAKVCAISRLADGRFSAPSHLHSPSCLSLSMASEASGTSMSFAFSSCSRLSFPSGAWPISQR